MSTPAKLQSALLPSECFFLAEDEMVEVIPQQGLDELTLIGLKTPKLTAMRRSQLPLWTALLLKSQGRLKIVPPKWLDEEELRSKYEFETNFADSFAEMPWHWIEIGQAILTNAPEDLSSPSHIIRNLLRDIREVRQAKVRAGLDYLNESHMQMDNLSGLEINEIRPFVGNIMDKLRRVHELVEEEDEEQEVNQYDDDI